MQQSEEAITQQMDSVLGNFESLFSQTCNQYLAEKLIDRVNTADALERRWVLRELEETLKENGVQLSPVLTPEGKIRNKQELVRAFPTQEDLEKKMYDTLSELYLQFPGTKEFIRRLVNRLGDKTLMKGSLRLRILKQFLLFIRKSVYSIKKLRALIENSFTEEERADFSVLKKEEEKRRFYAEHVKEDIFEALTDPAKFGLKNDDLRLLSISDNFARGRILNQGGTRRAIYEFAIVYGMTSYPPEDPRYDPDSDVEKNLFFDFQINGYIETLRERGGKAGADTANDELTTEGINYKNYAEVIYLYALNHPDLPREDKIYFAQNVIKACSASHSSVQGDEEESTTQLFRSYTLSELLTDRGYRLNQDELVQYISSHFPPAADRSVSPLMQSAKQNTARREYLLLCERFEDELRLYDRALDELDYTLGIFSGNGYDFDEEEYPFPEELRMILVDINEELRRHSSRMKDIIRGYKETRSRNGEIRKEPVLIRRIDFLVLYYEFFIAIHEDDSEEQILKLGDVYRSFADHLNPVFERARYASISSKSMPDVLLILFAYNMVSLLS